MEYVQEHFHIQNLYPLLYADHINDNISLFSASISDVSQYIFIFIWILKF